MSRKGRWEEHKSRRKAVSAAKQSFRDDRAVVLTNSQRFCTRARRPLSWHGWERIHPYLRSYGRLMDEGSRVIFFWGIAVGRLPRALVDGPTPMHRQVVLIGPNGT